MAESAANLTKKHEKRSRTDKLLDSLKRTQTSDLFVVEASGLESGAAISNWMTTVVISCCSVLQSSV